ncbi:sensory box/GGDEF family protein [Candidatus Vecturithrix granuli]|uniref:Sensory box/GGDEF family protein n=1 Tax=Vecturithrix granuli TaxID=1499967 RepID=A0A081C3K1_VECG1|nr:sensory box/GGDEF family protein [Candidatus Vecturithrix granuli]
MSSLCSDCFRILVVAEKTVLPEIFLSLGNSDCPDRRYGWVRCSQKTEAINMVEASLKEGKPFALAILCVERRSVKEDIRFAEQIRQSDSQLDLLLLAEDADLIPNNLSERIPPQHKFQVLQSPYSLHHVAALLSVLQKKRLLEHELRSVEKSIEKEHLEYKYKQEHWSQLERAVEMMQIGVFIVDLDGKILYHNPAAAFMHGYEEEELLGQELSFLNAPDVGNRSKLAQIQTWNGLIRENVHRRNDGTTFPVWLMSEIVQNADGEPWVIVTSCEDITERKLAEEELKKHRDHLEELVNARTSELTKINTQLQREILDHKRTAEALQKSEECYRTLLEAAPDPVVVYDGEGHVTYLNPAFSRVFGWTLEESRGQELNLVPVECLAENRLILKKIRQNLPVSGIETSRFTKAGKRIDVSISGAGFFDAQGALLGSVITIQDITERKKTEEEIRFIAYHDALTGLENRKSFYMRLEDHILRLHGKERRISDKWALMFLDLDRFKYINDTLGHDVGDELLKVIAVRLQKCVRKTDYVFRLGGDEFTILLNGLSTDADAARVAQKIRRTVALPCEIKNHELFITVSLGISIYPHDGQDVETLVKNADMAMYAAKEESEGYRFFTEEMNQKALERMRLERSLRTALQNNQFIVHYQPLINSQNRILGMEALVRWHHPEYGLINPSRFIPLAEETGAIVSIGKWVLHTACQQTKLWHDMGYANLYVSVNLSTRQFKEPDLIETIEQVLEVTGLPSNCLKLEVTESGIMENPDQAIVTMHYLRAKGIRFSIDDFGTGYSSLSYLKRFPIDTLKIDRSFVMDSIQNKNDQEIIKTIISMARTLNMEAIAEGVETREQHEFLIQQGCQMMQGYYLGLPMPAEQFQERLDIQKTSDLKSAPDN